MPVKEKGVDIISLIMLVMVLHIKEIQNYSGKQKKILQKNTMLILKDLVQKHQNPGMDKLNKLAHYLTLFFL